MQILKYYAAIVYYTCKTVTTAILNAYSRFILEKSSSLEWIIAFPFKILRSGFHQELCIVKIMPVLLI